MSGLALFVAVALSWIGIIAAAGWRICLDRSTMPSIHDERPLFSAADSFRRVPVHNLHRLHGRHRA
ncbi:hypothetical protein OHB26_26525 [Nocardia sp. NBC_01503]|uniref:hypothetical protein n=1 Tax=Nocardia sp. NBC_01503 TaxID=2975997 RepID=UPI002E7B1A0B|nr:hypothetical protein [Nocardia sp. NBC_01503]WTL30471.1 hypothetical protein OHB26_26525 [Nocardia sp. NBC_01503]